MRLLLIVAACCALVAFPSPPTGAQQRHGGGDRGDRGSWGGGRGGGGGGGFHRQTPTWGGGGGGGGRHYYSYRRPGWSYNPGYGWYDPSAAIGGAIGGWLWRQFNPPEPPQVIVVPQQPVRDLAYCYQRYKSFDGSTYLGYDGYRHPCP